MPRSTSYKRKRAPVPEAVKLARATARLAARTAANDRIHSAAGVLKTVYESAPQHIGEQNATRIYKGQGAYWGKELGSSLGGYVGSHFGLSQPMAEIGGSLGDRASDWAEGKARSLAKRYLGLGDYANSLMVGGSSSAQFQGAEDGSLIVTNTEFIRDIYAPSVSSFTLDSTIIVNPGLQSSLPFLSQFAANFQQYQMLQLVLEYRSLVDTTSSNNPTGTAGQFMLIEYDPSDTFIPTSKEEIMNAFGGMAVKCSENGTFGVECDPTRKAGSAVRSVRTFGLAPTEMPQDFDWAKILLAFNNIPSAYYGQAVGTLHAYYTCRLIRPKLGSAVSQNLQVYRGVSTGNESSAWILGGSANLTPSPNYAVASRSNLSMEVLESGLTGIRFRFPRDATGLFEIKICCEGTVMAPVALGQVVYTIAGGVSKFSDQYSSVFNAGDQPADSLIFVGPTASCVICHVKVTNTYNSSGNDNLVYFSNWFTATTVTQTYVEVTEITNRLQTSAAVNNPTYVNVITGAVVNPGNL